LPACRPCAWAHRRHFFGRCCSAHRQEGRRRTTCKAVETERSLPDIQASQVFEPFRGPATGLAGARGDDLVQPVRQAGRVRAKREGNPGRRSPSTGKGRPQDCRRSRLDQIPCSPPSGLTQSVPRPRRSRRSLARSPPGVPISLLNNPPCPRLCSDKTTTGSKPRKGWQPAWGETLANGQWLAAQRNSPVPQSGMRRPDRSPRRANWPPSMRRYGWKRQAAPTLHRWRPPKDRRSTWPQRTSSAPDS
jgi:hypothetical protein